MALLSTTSPTLADLAKRQDPDGKIAKIIEILNTQNEMLLDIPWMGANDGTGHRTTVRSGLPAGTWRKLNYGVQPEKSTTVQVRDGTGMLETYAEVDRALVDLSDDKAAWMMSEHKAFLEGMSQTMGTQLIYGDASVNPEKITGLAPRYNSLSAENGDNILDAGGTGSTNTSIWLIAWDDTTAHGIYPRGSTGGLKVGENKEETLFDAQGGRYEGYRTHYKWDAGIVIRDWRYAVRIANIDVNALKKDAATGADLVDLMVQALEILPNQSTGSLRFYVPRVIRSYLRRQIKNKSNVWLSMGEVAGKTVLQFDDVPVRRMDAILSTEARVV
jgi:hypothetical protein